MSLTDMSLSQVVIKINILEWFIISFAKKKSAKEPLTSLTLSLLHNNSWEYKKKLMISHSLFVHTYYTDFNQT